MQSAVACILHMDLDSFYVSVEVRRNPDLRDRPVVVGGGVVLSASYPARRFGIRSGMSTAAARRRCPRLVVVGGNFAEYAELSRRVFRICRRFTPVVEPISIDEAFLDVGGSVHLLGEPRVIGTSLRLAIRDETGLPSSVGIARTKHLAKIASRRAKPDGLVAVDPRRELAFLHALEVEMISGIGPTTAAKLHRLGIRTVGDLAAVPVAGLAGSLGSGAARHLHALAWNRDPRSVRADGRRGSIGAQSTFGRNVTGRTAARRVLLRLADRVSTRLRAAGREGRTITVTARFADFETVTRRTTVPGTTSSTTMIYTVARGLLDELLRRSRGRGLRLVGVSVGGLRDAPPLQLELPLPGHDVPRPGSPGDLAQRAIDRAVDDARASFGREAVQRASLLGEIPLS